MRATAITRGTTPARPGDGRVVFIAVVVATVAAPSFFFSLSLFGLREEEGKEANAREPWRATRLGVSQGAGRRKVRQVAESQTPGWAGTTTKTINVFVEGGEDGGC